MKNTLYFCTRLKPKTKKIIMPNHNPKKELGSDPINKLIFRFGIPTIISGLINAAYNIADQIFIGQSIGVLGNAATNVTFPLVTICIGLSMLVSVGTCTSFNLSMGRKKEKEAGQLMGNGIMMLLICSILLLTIVLIFLTPVLTAFGATKDVMPYAKPYAIITTLGIPAYMMSTGGVFLIRSDASPRYAMAASLTGVIINCILDPIFIFALNMGITGAALATVISQTISCILIIRYFIFDFSTLQLKKEFFILKWKSIKNICIQGFAPFLAHIAMVAVQIALNNALKYYGALSSYGSNIPLAVSGIIGKCNYLFMSVAVGMAQGAQPIFSYNYGAGNYKRVREGLKSVIISVSIVNLLGFIVFQLFPHQITSFFGNGNKEYYEFSVKYFRIFMFMIIVNGLQPISGNFYNAIGKPIYGVLMSICRRFLLLLPLIIFLPMRYGINGILYSGPISDGIAFIIITIFIANAFAILRRKEKQQ